MTKSPSFFHYLVQVVQIQSISLFHQLPYNRTIDFMLFCSVFSHKLFRQKKEKQQFYNFLTFAIERFVVFKFKVSFMEFYLYRKKKRVISSNFWWTQKISTLHRWSWNQCCGAFLGQKKPSCLQQHL